ncbi:MAG: hypothetical protein AAGB46_10545 [Verrucomicrobiota bacterium]
MPEIDKLFRLLETYEELTAKEAFCLKEVNLEGVKEVQVKKAPILKEMQRLRELLSMEEAVLKEDYNRRVADLLAAEDRNEKRLGELMAENRMAYRRLSNTTTAASKAVRAYGHAGQPSVSPKGKMGEA